MSDNNNFRKSKRENRNKKMVTKNMHTGMCRYFSSANNSVFYIFEYSTHETSIPVQKAPDKNDKG